jgi:hypothetical protein
MVGNISAKDLSLKIFLWRKYFIITTLVAALLMGVLIFLIPKQYKSTAVVFPARNFSVSKLLIEQNLGNQEDYLQLGDEDDAEKMLQVLNSDALKIKVADAFNLWERWKIKDTVFGFHYLKLKWDDMVAFKRTPYNSVKIEVYDYTANGAAQIANGILDYCDTVKHEMINTVAKGALKIVEQEYGHTLTMMAELEDSLQSLRVLGVLDYKTDVESYTRSYAKAIEKGSKTAVIELEKKLDVLKKYGGAYLNINEKLKKYRFKYPVLKSKYDEALVNTGNILPLKFVVEKAIPNEYKAKPKRMMLLFISILSANFFCLLALLLNEKLKKKS